MFNLWERIVKMMEQGSPLLVLRGLAEADNVIFETFPLHEQDVTVRLLDTPLQFVATVTIHSTNDLLRFFECELELLFMARLNVKLRNFKNHVRRSEEACTDSQSAFGGMPSQTTPFLLLYIPPDTEIAELRPGF
jgi:hypothetical protein